MSSAIVDPNQRDDTSEATTNNEGSDTGMASNSNSISSILGQSIHKRLVSNTIAFLFYMQDNAATRRGKTSYLVVLGIVLYMICAGTFMSTLTSSTSSFGEWGRWIFLVLNWPITFSFERLPYMGSVIVAFISVAIVWSFQLFILIAFYLFSITSKYLLFTKSSFHTWTKIYLILSLPMMYVMLNTVQCNLETNTLNAFSDFSFQHVACSGTLHYAFMAVFIVTSLMMVMTNIFCLLLVTNINPTLYTPFISDTPLIFMVLQLANVIELFVHMIVPSPYSYARSAFHCVSSLLLVIILFKLVPFLKRVDNTVVAFGFGARLGASLGALISQIISVTVNFKEQDKNPILLGLSLLVIVMAIIFGFVFATAMEIYTRFSLHKIRSELVEFISNMPSNSQQAKTEDETNPTDEIDSSLYTKMLETSGIYFYQTVEEANLKKALRMFIRFSLMSNSEVHSPDHSVYVSDIDACVAFIKGISFHSSFSDIYLYIMFSSIISHVNPSDPNAQMFARSLLKKAKRKRPGLFYKYLITVKTKEITMNENARSFELQKSIDELETKQDILRVLHKDVWKELTNEVINYHILESIMIRIGDLSTECDTKYSNLMSNYSSDKNIVKSYARFLESFMFNKEEAAELYSEAMKLEADESTKSKRIGRSRGKNQLKSNKVVPTLQGSSVRQSFSKVVEKQDAFEFSDVGSVFSREAFDGIENKNDSYRQNLQIPHSTTFRYFMFGILVTFSIIFLLVTLTISIYFSTTVTNDVNLVLEACSPLTVNGQMLLFLRAYQAHLHLYRNTSKEWPKTMSMYGLHSFDEYKQFHTKALLENLQVYKSIKNNANSGKFSVPLYSSYHEKYYLLYKPQAIASENGTFLFGDRLAIRASIADITNMAITYSNEILEFSDEDYAQTFESHAFMWMYTNNATITNAYNDFCNVHLQYSVRNGRMLESIFYGVYFLCFVIYLTFSISFLVYLSKELKFTNLQFKLFQSNISKNVIGKIYHKLSTSTKNQLAIKTEYHKLLNPRVLIMTMCIIIVSFTIISAGLFLQEMLGNGLYSRQTYVTMKDSNDASYHLLDVMFAITEVYMHRAFNQNLTFNDPPLQSTSQISLFTHGGLESLVAVVRYFWNLCAYGSSIKADESLIIGMYQDIDAIIKGEANCSTQNVMKYGLNCTSSLDLDVAETLDTVLSVNQLTITKNPLVHEQFIKAMLYLDRVSERLIQFSGKFAIYAEVPSFVIAPLFGTLSFVALFGFSLGILKVFISYSNAVNFLRMMLNYVPNEAIDSSEALKNYLFFHNIEKTNKNFVQRKLHNLTHANKDSSQIDLSIVHSIINASIDGVAMCVNSTDIDAFNPVAQSMFGFAVSDIVGKSLFQLFDEEIIPKMQKSIENMVLARRSDKSANNNGEIFETECIRKNKTRFPAKISIYLVTHSNKEIVVCFINDQTSEKKRNALLQEEKQHSEELLLNILPYSVANQLKNSSGDKLIAEKLNDVTVFFSDMVGFTSMSSNMTPTELVTLLNEIVVGFDLLTEKYNLEKIKTIGDAYFCVGGLHDAQTDHPERMCKFACETFGVLRAYNKKRLDQYIQKKLPTLNSTTASPLRSSPPVPNSPSQSLIPERPPLRTGTSHALLHHLSASVSLDGVGTVGRSSLEKSSESTTSLFSGTDKHAPPIQINIRVGINNGKCVAGVIGKKKFAYDLWGDTINVASRMESTGVAGRIQISRSTYERVHDQGYEFEERRVFVKGKGDCQTYLINEKHHPCAIVQNEVEPNSESMHRFENEEDSESLLMDGTDGSQATTPRTNHTSDK